MVVNGVSGGVDYALSEAISGKTPSLDGLKVNVGVGFTAGLVGEALPGYKSQTLDFYGGQVYQRSPVTAYNEFNGTLRSFARKELLLQGVDDAIRSGGVSTLTNYLNNNLK